MRPYTRLAAALLSIIPLLTMTTNGFAQNTETELRIGVRAINGTEKAILQWSDTARALSEQVDGFSFRLVPIVEFSQMRAAVQNREVDFVLTNPLAYIDLNKQFSVHRILTLNKKQPSGIASTSFASVIFTRTDATNINQFSDFKGKSIMGVHPEAFGGWQMAERELLLQNINLEEENIETKFTQNNSHQSVVSAILNKQADIGVIRSGIIERLISEGTIKGDELKIINQHHDSYPSIHSTTHYPEWPFSVLPHISDKVSNKVFHALLSIKPKSKAAMSGNYINWAVPLDYSEVNQLISDIKYRHVTFSNIWQEHKTTIRLIIIFVLAITIYTLYLLSINRKLASSERELHHHRNHLEELVEERTTELNQEAIHHKKTASELSKAKLAADEANKAKSEFLSQMSHELRTPLNAILGFGQLIKMDTTNNSDTYDNTEEILTAGKYLLSLINEILDLSKIESGSLEVSLQKTDCSDILNECISLIKPIADEQGISISILSTDQCSVSADKKYLKQICINLLSNAIKYNKINGKIEIKLENLNNSCKLSIKDNGIGIEEEFKDNLFTPFARAQGNTSLIEGSGIGLTITKRLIENMSGEIGFHSESGKGSEFWITLPTSLPSKKLNQIS